MKLLASVAELYLGQFARLRLALETRLEYMRGDESGGFGKGRDCEITSDDSSMRREAYSSALALHLLFFDMKLLASVAAVSVGELTRLWLVFEIPREYIGGMKGET